MKGIWGTERKLQDGSSVVADSAYIARSIKEPMAQVAADYPAAMVLARTPSDAEIELLTAYIRSLAD